MTHEYRAETGLINEAKVVLEKMVWGYALQDDDGRHGLWETASYDLPFADQIDYTDPAGDTRSFRQNGQNIEFIDADGDVHAIYDPNGAAADDPEHFSAELTFTQNLANVVQVDLVLGRNVGGRWHYVSASTQVSTRN